MRKQTLLKTADSKTKCLSNKFSRLYLFGSLALFGSAKFQYKAKKCFRLKQPKNETNKRLFLTL